jgi:hypothetical protein
MPELKQEVKMPERAQLPQIGGQSAKMPGFGPWNRDPNLAPERLGQRKTDWVILNDDM